MYFTRLIAALFVIAKICKNFVAPHLENEFRKIWFIYNMEYCSTINSKDIMNCANKWMDLENIILAFVFLFSGFFTFKIPSVCVYFIVSNSNFRSYTIVVITFTCFIVFSCRFLRDLFLSSYRPLPVRLYFPLLLRGFIHFLLKGLH